MLCFLDRILTNKVIALRIFFSDQKDWDREETDGELDEQRPCEFCNGCYKSKKILLEHVRGIHKVEYVEL